MDKLTQIAWNQYVRHKIPIHVEQIIRQVVKHQGAPAIIQLTKLLHMPSGVAQIICNYADWNTTVTKMIQRT
jgi:hypothetical protein